MKYTLYKTEYGDYMLGRKRLIGKEEFWSGTCWWRDRAHINRYCMKDKEYTTQNVRDLINERNPSPSKQAMVVSKNLNDILNYLERDLI